MQAEDFQVGERLAVSAHAEVFAAIHKRDQRRAILKIPLLGAPPKLQQRMLYQEAVIGAARSPHLVDVLGCGESPRGTFLAAEFVDGGTLERLLAPARPLPAPVAVRIALDVAKGLVVLHRSGVAHGALTADKVLIDRAGLAKLHGFALPDKPPAFAQDLRQLARLIARMAAGSAGAAVIDPLSTTATQSPERMAVELFAAAPHLPAILERSVAQLLRAPASASADALNTVARQLDAALVAMSPQGRDVLRAWLQDPRTVGEQLRQAQADAETARAEALWTAGGEQKPAALIAQFRAVLVAPDKTRPTAILQRLTGGRAAFLTALPNELAAPAVGDADAIKALIEVLRGRQEQLLAAIWSKRYLVERPGDAHVRRGLLSLLGDAPPTAPYGAASLSVFDPAAEPAPLDVEQPAQGSADQDAAASPDTPAPRVSDEVEPSAWRTVASQLLSMWAGLDQRWRLSLMAGVLGLSFTLITVGLARSGNAKLAQVNAARSAEVERLKAQGLDEGTAVLFLDGKRLASRGDPRGLIYLQLVIDNAAAGSEVHKEAVALKQKLSAAEPEWRRE